MGVPHSTITAAYIEGGILGLVGWVLLMIVPLVALGRRWLRGVTDDIANIALCGGTASLITQLSLNAPLHEHIWLWAGAVIGALARPEVEKPSKETATFPGPKLASSMKARPGIKPMPGSKAKPLSAGQSPKTASNDALKLRRRQGQFPVKPRHDRGTHKT